MTEGQRHQKINHCDREEHKDVHAQEEQQEVYVRASQLKMCSANSKEINRHQINENVKTQVHTNVRGATPFNGQFVWLPRDKERADQEPCHWAKPGPLRVVLATTKGLVCVCKFPTKIY